MELKKMYETQWLKEMGQIGDVGNNYATVFYFKTPFQVLLSLLALQVLLGINEMM